MGDLYIVIGSIEDDDNQETHVVSQYAAAAIRDALFNRQGADVSAEIAAETQHVLDAFGSVLNKERKRA